MSIDKFDRRVVERKIQEGRVSREDYEKFLKAEEMTAEEFEQLSQTIEAQFTRRSGVQAEEEGKAEE